MKQLPKLVPIGTVEMVSLPDDAIFQVPAKIDTGADGSAIWASNVHMQNGKLTCNLFAPGSAYYQEEPLTTTEFRATSVKNSFGDMEMRYKIRLRITIGNHSLKRWFSLADRSRNTYPILLGKNLLSKRFIVDVSQRNLISGDTATQKVLVLGAVENADFFKQVGQQSVMHASYDCPGYDSLLFSIDGLKTRVYSADQDIADYALTYFKSHKYNNEMAVAAAKYLHFKGRPFIDRELQESVSQSKLTEYMALACYDLPLPKTMCAKTQLFGKSYDKLVDQLGAPFVLKEIASDRGRNNYFIESEAEFKRVLKKSASEQIFVAQKYVENDGFLRLYVFGKEVCLAVSRSPHKHKDPLKRHLNKPAGGANAKQLDVNDVPMEVREIAVAAANCLNRQVAGVDILQDKVTGAWYILEVNNGPQLRSGRFVAEKTAALAKYLDKELKR